MTTVLLDSHALYWFSSKSKSLSRAAARAVNGADELAVASITWFELGWLAEHRRIRVTLPVRAWLEDMSSLVRTVSTTPAIAATAVALGPAFPSDPTDRIIYATAVEHGWQLVTKDDRMREFPQARRITIW